MYVVAIDVCKVSWHIQYANISSKPDGIYGEVEDFVDVQEEGNDEVVLYIVKESLC